MNDNHEPSVPPIERSDVATGGLRLGGTCSAEEMPEESDATDDNDADSPPFPHIILPENSNPFDILSTHLQRLRRCAQSNWRGDQKASRKYRNSLAVTCIEAEKLAIAKCNDLNIRYPEIRPILANAEKFRILFNTYSGCSHEKCRREFSDQAPEGYSELCKELRRLSYHANCYLSKSNKCHEDRQGLTQEPDSHIAHDAISILRSYAKDELKGKQRAVIEILCDRGGEMSLADLAVQKSIEWGNAKACFESTQQKLKVRLKKLGWQLSRRDGSARLTRPPTVANEKPAQK